VHLTITKHKPLIFSVLGSTVFHVMNICIFMILYDLILLPAQLHYVIMNILYLKSHVWLVDQYALWKFISYSESFVLQALLQIPRWGKCKSLLI
jgi:hypothetical protein